MAATDDSEETVIDLKTTPDPKLVAEIRIELKIDAELLLEAQRQIGAESPDLAVNEALRRLVDQERAKRQAAQDRLKKMYEDGAIDLSAIDE